MGYYFSKILEMPFAQATQHVTDALAGKGFGVLTTIDVRATMKKKLDIEFRPYTILGVSEGMVHDRTGQPVMLG